MTGRIVRDADTKAATGAARVASRADTVPLDPIARWENEGGAVLSSVAAHGTRRGVHTGPPRPPGDSAGSGGG